MSEEALYKNLSVTSKKDWENLKRAVRESRKWNEEHKDWYNNLKIKIGTKEDLIKWKNSINSQTF